MLKLIAKIAILAVFIGGGGILHNLDASTSCTTNAALNFGLGNGNNQLSGRIVNAVLREATNYYNNSFQQLRVAYNHGELSITPVSKSGIIQYDVIFEGVEICLIIDL